MANINNLIYPRLFFYDMVDYYETKDGKYYAIFDDGYGYSYKKGYYINIDELREIWEVKAKPFYLKCLNNSIKNNKREKVYYEEVIKRTDKTIYNDNFQYTIFDYGVKRNNEF